MSKGKLDEHFNGKCLKDSRCDDLVKFNRGQIKTKGFMLETLSLLKMVDEHHPMGGPENENADK